MNPDNEISTILRGLDSTVNLEGESEIKKEAFGAVGKHSEIIFLK